MKTIEQEKMRTLPIFKHFDQMDLTKTGKDALEKFKNGEKPLFRLLQGVTVGGVAYLSWVYVLPPLFMAIGTTLAVAGSAILTLFLILLSPVIFKKLRRLTRTIHEGVIRSRPFEELAEQREKMVENKTKFIKAKGKISGIQDEMETAASEKENEAKKLRDSIVNNNAKAKKIKEALQEMEAKGGKAAKTSTEYALKNSELIRTVSDGQREASMLEQKQGLVSKYGTRGVVMKKFGNKLIMIETAMDIKLQDFDATVEILKQDYEFAQKSREATEMAKSAMMFTEGWEVEYALDVVTSTIAEDIAITTGNLNDINKYTANFNLDNDEMFNNLDKLANDIKIGTNVLPDADKYNDPDYVLTSEDRKEAGKFGQIF